MNADAAGTTAAGTTDAGTTDAGTTDAGTTDAGTTDTAHAAGDAACRAAPHESPPGLLVLHAVRLTGFAETAAIARRFETDPTVAEDLLLDAQALGQVSRTAFADLSGWSLTEAGRAENERLLAAELATTGCGDRVREAHTAFLPLNARLLRACTDWQLRPAPGGRLAPNDHADPAWDAAVLDELGALGRELRPLVARLAGALARFGGYDERFATALARARSGDRAGVDGTGIDSCHRVWFELHEDLVATLGIDRRREA